MDHFIFFLVLAFIFYSHVQRRQRKNRPALKGKLPLRIRPNKQPQEAPALCDGAAAVLTESKERSPLKESLEELRPSVQEVSNQEEMKEAQKASAEAPQPAAETAGRHLVECYFREKMVE